jgi:hypothetical protein
MDLRRLTHEQLVTAVSTRLGATDLSPGTARARSLYLSEPSASAVRIEVYKRTRRAARPLTPLEQPLTGGGKSEVELTYMDLIAAARVASRPSLAQTA